MVSLATGVVAAVVALGVSLLLPKRYAANASVIIDVKPDPISGMLYAGMMSPAIIATQVDILSSDRVALRVIQDLHLDQNAAIRAQWQAKTGGEGNFNQWLADLLQNHLLAVPSKESNVLTVGYSSEDPAAAAAFANAFVDAYLAVSVELRVAPAREYASFFERRIKDARSRLAEAQSRLGAFQRENGIVGSDERIDVETVKLNELSTQVLVMQSAAAETASRRQQATGGNGDRLAEALTNPVISSLKVDLARAEGNLQELNSRLGGNHPQVIQARASIAEIKARLEAETKRVTGGVSVSADINNARLGEARAALEQQRQKVLHLKEARDQLTVLQHDVDGAQHEIETIAARANQSGLESQAQQSNINVLSRATPPATPSSPKILLNVAAALVLGLFFGVVASFIKELLDRRVRLPEDVVQAIGLPVLAVMPRPLQSKDGKLSLMAQRVISGRLPAPGKK